MIRRIVRPQFSSAVSIGCTEVERVSNQCWLSSDNRRKTSKYGIAVDISNSPSGRVCRIVCPKLGTLDVIVRAEVKHTINDGVQTRTGIAGPRTTVDVSNSPSGLVRGIVCPQFTTCASTICIEVNCIADQGFEICSRAKTANSADNVRNQPSRSVSACVIDEMRSKVNK